MGRAVALPSNQPNPSEEALGTSLRDEIGGSTTEPAFSGPGSVEWGSITVLVAWSVVGVVVALSFSRGRRGSWPHLVLGAVLGPLMLPVLADRRAVLDHCRSATELSPGRPGSGPVDVLVGVEDASDAVVLIQQTRAILGDRLGRMIIARVVEDDLDGAWSDQVAAAAIDLEVAAALTEDSEPATVLVTGSSATALQRFARERGYDLIVGDARLGRELTPADPPVLVIAAASRPGRDRRTGRS